MSEVALPRRVQWRVDLCIWYFRRWMSKSFHGIRLSKTGWIFPVTDARPVLVVMNHPSWWDPLFGLVLSHALAGYECYAPMEAKALKQYPIFEPLGIYGVEQTPQGAIAFLRTSAAILGGPKRSVWLTAQGRFADPRERPIELRPGVGHLLRRLKGAIVIPLAIEYPFWQERYPEALAHFGTPMFVEDGRSHSVEEWVSRVQNGLTVTMDELAALARTQDDTKFHTLAGGNVGIGGIYDVWRRFKAIFGGRRFAAGHRDSVRAGSGEDA